VVLTYEDKVDGPYKPYQDDMKLSVSTGGGPDIIGSDMIDDIEPYVKNGYLECLDDLKPTEGEYEEAAFESCRVDGKMYGIPYTYHIAHNAPVLLL
jgi:ABC-type glycerol-3-phosphate transport system substrate-binding protein